MKNANLMAGRDGRVILLIGAAHFMSHYFIFVLPPILPLLKVEFDVSYTALGFAIMAFNIVSLICQPPAGFLVDRLGATKLLIAGLALGSLAFAGMGLMPTYWALIGFAGLAGLANSVFHPADYAILSASVSGKRMGRAYSLHTFAGFAGGAAAPLAMALILQISNWQTGLLLTGGLGVVVTIALFVGRNSLIDERSTGSDNTENGRVSGKTGMKLLLSTPILMCFAFFTLISVSAGGLTGFGVVAFVDLHDMSLSKAQLALTCFLVGNALGILFGGYIADRTAHHERVAMFGFLTTAVIIYLIGIGSWPGNGVIAAMALAGILYGIIMPSRDMLVRAITPKGQTGKVFGFVTAGFNVGGIITPVLFGQVMDSGNPQLLFVLAPMFMLVAAATVLATRSVQGAAREASGTDDNA
jgi:MFS transporter, FSR family, fosmidomycin resistance protein